MAGKMKILMGELTKPLKTATIASGTTLGKFLKSRKKAYDSTVRVNGNVVNEDYKLHSGDLIIFIAQVSGGI